MTFSCLFYLIRISKELKKVFLCQSVWSSIHRILPLEFFRRNRSGVCRLGNYRQRRLEVFYHSQSFVTVNSGYINIHQHYINIIHVFALLYSLDSVDNVVNSDSGFLQDLFEIFIIDQSSSTTKTLKRLRSTESEKFIF